MEDKTPQLTLGLMALRVGGGVQHHHLDRLCRRNLIPHTRVGRLRLVRVSDLDTIRKACVEAGYYVATESALAYAAPKPKAAERLRLTGWVLLDRLCRDPDPLVRRWAMKLRTGKELVK